MNALRIVAVDDEPLALDRIGVLLRHDRDVALVATASSCQSGVQATIDHRPDLLLLDVRMRDGTAFDLLSALPPHVAPMVIFVTAYAHYAHQAFDVEAVGYLLKPVQRDELNRALDKARRHLRLTSAQQRAEELQSLVERLQAPIDAPAISHFPTEFWVRHRAREHVRVPVGAIDWIEANGDYSCIHAEGREHLLRIPLARLLAALDPALFTRIHRSIVIRNDRVATVMTRRSGARAAVLSDGSTLPVGRLYARQLAWHARA
jgi:DNA-binding LytR/AlgR family response regulator